MAPSPELSDLIRDIGVERVTHSGVVARFVLPELGSVPPEDRLKLLQHVRANWAELKEDTSLVNHFKEVIACPGLGGGAGVFRKMVCCGMGVDAGVGVVLFVIFAVIYNATVVVLLIV